MDSSLARTRALELFRSTPAASAIAGAGLLIALGDYLLWGAMPGIALGMFVLIAAGVVILVHRAAWKPRSTATVCSVLLAASAIQTGIEVSFSNLFVTLLLLAAIMGESCFPGLRPVWGRWLEGVMRIVLAPLGWSWLRASAPRIVINRHRAGELFEAGVSVVAPVVLIGSVFLILLAMGNAIFARWVSNEFSAVLSSLPAITPTRVIFWLVLSTLALGLVRSSLPMAPIELWQRDIPALPAPLNVTVSRVRSILLLLVLNGMFFAANTIDATHLWIEQKVMAGVTYSQFVHHGVYSLIAAVVLSAAVLAGIFQQAQSVTGSKTLRALSYIWIGQNIVLIASVFLRLRLYVEAYQLTELRVYVGAFLVLVTAGFSLLAWRIVKNRDLRWLIGGNLLAAFALLFTLQFVDVRRWIADYNVGRWEQDTKRTLDVKYLLELGPSAYPALIKVTEAKRSSSWERAEAERLLRSVQDRAVTQMADLNWRSTQVRRDGYVRQLAAWSSPSRP